MPLEAGGWDVWVALIQAVPPALGVGVIAVVLILLWPQLKTRISRDDVEIEVPVLGGKVKLADASTNFSATIVDLQNRVKALEEPVSAEQSDQPPQPEGGPSPDRSPGTHASTAPGVLLWIDRSPGEHTIETSQITKAGWTLIHFWSIEDAAKTYVGPPSRPAPHAIVLVSQTVIPAGLAGLMALFPDATAIIYGAGLGDDRMVGIYGSQSALVTSSAIGLLTALTGTRCGQCLTLLAEPSILSLDERKPCWHCGSTRRTFFRDLKGSLTVSSDATLATS